ncbi:MAG: hypothetical protein ACP5JY_02660, partial [Candidatus Nanoarchaeia archaeon]
MGKELTESEYLLVCRCHPDEKVRKLAGEQIVKKYVQEGWYDDLIKLVENNNVPEDVRELAGNKIG